MTLINMLARLQGRKWRRLAAWILVPVATASLCFLGPPAYWLCGHRICDRVYVESVPVSGLDVREARRAVLQQIAPPKIMLCSPGRTWFLSLKECGGSMQVDQTVAKALRIGRGSNPLTNAWIAWRTWYYGKVVPLQFCFEERALRHALRRIAWTVNIPKRDARIEVNEGYVHAVEGQWGRHFAVQTTGERIVKGFGLQSRSVTVDIRQVRPKVMAYDLRSIDTVIGEFATRFNPGKVNRTSNIRTVCQQLNGQAILPGETFSFNATTGERTIHKGYRVAQIFVDHEIVDGVGGGVCQVSTTLYNCVRRLHLPVVERHPHSLPVPYIRTGLDATVSYPYRDLKFKNTLSSPIAIWTNVSGGRLTAFILGEKGNGAELTSG